MRDRRDRRRARPRTRRAAGSRPFDHGSSACTARPPGWRAITKPSATPAIVACTPGLVHEAPGEAASSDHRTRIGSAACATGSRPSGPQQPAEQRRRAVIAMAASSRSTRDCTSLVKKTAMMRIATRSSSTASARRKTRTRVGRPGRRPRARRARRRCRSPSGSASRRPTAMPAGEREVDAARARRRRRPPRSPGGSPSRAS